MFDYFIKNVTVVDGSGTKRYEADVGISDGKFTYIGNTLEEKNADCTIDGKGKILIPGFIDSHSHYDTSMFIDAYKYQRVPQGVSTEIVGYCGPSLWPFSKDKEELFWNIYYPLTSTGLKFDWNWNSIDELFNRIEKSGTPENIATFIGHGALRTAVLKHENRHATEAELDIMCGILDEAMSKGAIGLALGLNYVPGVYSDANELCKLAAVVKQRGGILAAHRRDEGNNAV